VNAGTVILIIIVGIIVVLWIVSAIYLEKKDKR